MLQNRKYARCASLRLRVLVTLVILQPYNARHHGDGPVYVAWCVWIGTLVVGFNLGFGARQARVEGGSRRVVLTYRLSCFCLQQAYLAASGPVSL